MKHNFFYFIREGIRGIFKHGFMSFASISVITTCLAVTGTVILLVMTLTGTITYLGETGDICAYVDETWSDQESAALGIEICELPNISKMEYIDRTRGLEELREELGEESAVLDGLEDDNPLRNYYRLWVESIDDYAQTVENVQAVEGIADVYASVEAMQVLQRIRTIMTYAGIAFIVLLGTVAVFLISNTLKLASFDRREEIGIMKMLGATNAFVRAPFFIESMILSILSAVLAFLLQTLIGKALLTSGLSSLSFVKIADFRDYIVEFAAGDAVIALFFGISGSLSSIRKFLRV